MNSIEIVKSYQHLKQMIPDLIKRSGYRNDFIAEKLGMKPAYFSVKKQRSNWSDKEVEKILQIINNEEVENYFMLEIMRSRKNDENVPLEELKQEFGWK